MGRILAIDYGGKRCGLAVTDPLRIIANALETVGTQELVTYLQKYCSENQVDILVFGQPKRMSNEASEIEGEIAKTIQKVQQVLPNVKIDRYDERFTSKMAAHALFQSGASKKQRRVKENLDKVSATIILQDYLTNGLTSI